MLRYMSLYDIRVGCENVVGCMIDFCIAGGARRLNFVMQCNEGMAD